MATTAKQKVFGICELAEQIFLELSMKDLLLVQRVCKAWRATIQSSSVCRKALFLEPGKASDVNIEMHDPEAHKLKAKCSRCTFQPEDIARFKHEIVFNPLLVEPWKSSGYLLRSHLHCSAYDEHRLYTGLLDVPTTASCRQMLISQPPLPFATSAIAILYKSAWEGNEPPPLESMPNHNCGRVVSWLEASPGHPKVLGGGYEFGNILESLQKSIRPTEKIWPRSYWAVTWTGEQPTWKNKAEEVNIRDGAKEVSG